MMKKHSAAKRENFRRCLEHYEEDQTSLCTFFALVMTVSILVLVACALAFLPNTLDTAYIEAHYNLPLKYFVPEAPETAQYLVLSVLFPVLFVVFYKLFAGVRGRQRDLLSAWTPAFKPIEFFVIAIVSVWSVYGNYKGVQGFSQAVNRRYTVLIGLIVVLWAFLAAGFAVYYEHSARLRRFFLYPALALFVAGVLFAAWLYRTDHYFMNSYTLHHFDAYYYPIFEVYYGKTLLIDFTSLYGFYPYFIVPLLKLTGGISMFRVSLIMAFLVLLNAGAIGATLWLNVKNKILALAGFLAVTFASFLSSLIINNGYYLQYFPHRTIGPALLLLTATLWLRAQKPLARRILTLAGYALCVVSLLWNVDSGVVTAAAWCFFLLYDTACRHTLKEKAFYLQALKICFYTGLSVLLAAFCVFLTTFLRSGMLVTLPEMLSAQILFKGTGYYMLRMPLRYPWIILAAIYMAGLVKSLRGMPYMEKNEIREATPRQKMYFLLSILGVGLFSYYQGRSHRDVFIAVIWPGILLATLFAAEYAERLAKRREVYLEAGEVKKVPLFVEAGKLFLIAGLLITLSVSFLVLDLKDGRVAAQIHTTASQTSQKDIIKHRLSFIARNTTKAEDVDILTMYFTEYYTLLGVKNPMPLRSIIDWATKEDYRKVLDYLEITDNKLFLDRKTATLLSTYVPEEFNEILNRRFTLVETYDTISYYIPKDS